MFVVLFTVSIITFTLMHAVPGGPFAAEKAVPPAVLKNLNAKYHLDDPFIIQYISYVGDILLPRVLTGKQRPGPSRTLVRDRTDFRHAVVIEDRRPRPKLLDAGPDGRDAASPFARHDQLSIRLPKERVRQFGGH